jgi:hypothetical protein
LPKYDEIDWEEAACRGSIYTDIFYNVEEERSILAYEYINALRTICLACPIWKQCLTYAMEHEDYGVWGGMTSVERFSFKNLRSIRINKGERCLHLKKRVLIMWRLWSVSVEPIRQVQGDTNKEQRVANFISQKMPWSLFPTPKFYFTDYHINRKHDNGRENYIGDLEIKWLNSPSTAPCNLSLQQITNDDGSACLHRYA